MFTRFSHPMLCVNDVSRAIKWYCDTLGFSVQADYAPHYAILWHEPMRFRLDLHPDRSKQNVGRGTMIYFEVENLDSAIAALRSKGAKCEDPRTEGTGPRFASFTDSEGNNIGICEPQ